MGLNSDLTKKIPTLKIQVWVLVAVCVGVSLVIILLVLAFYLSEKKSKKNTNKFPVTENQTISTELKEIRVDHNEAYHHHPSLGGLLNPHKDNLSDKNSSNRDKTKNSPASIISPSDSFNHLERNDNGSGSGEMGKMHTYHSSSHTITSPSPLSGLPEFSHLGWGHWFTLRDLEVATNRFSRDNVIGEGGYGVVYRGYLMNGAPVAVKKLFNNSGQAEKEFRVEVEAIGHVRHKNLVRLLGYCIEGIQRLLVYEYVNNGNLEQWLRGQYGEYLTWEARMKIILGTAKALMYLHEAIEPKVVHRDIKSSNILVDEEFNAKLSDFGLAKLLSAGKTHITTRVMGTFGYVAPEYANSGLLNEKSDVYSFGVLLLEAITGRDPVDYNRPADEVNLVDWLKMMVGSRRSEEVVDPYMEIKPSRITLKRVLLTALRCVDPDADKRLTMSQVVRMLESDDNYPLSREGRKHGKNEAGHAGPEVTEPESQTETSDTERDN